MIADKLEKLTLENVELKEHVEDLEEQIDELELEIEELRQEIQAIYDSGYRRKMID